jgi:hypothetical protein
MASSDERGREILREAAVAGDETATLLGSLERQRVNFAWKCGGLDAAGLRATVGASTMTLGGLLKHLALVEEEYFSRRLLGREFGPPWDTADWDADRDWEWHSAAEDSPEQLYTLWQDAVTRSRAAVAEAQPRAARETAARSSTSAPSAMSKPATSYPRRRRWRATGIPTLPRSPVTRTRIAPSCRGGDAAGGSRPNLSGPGRIALARLQAAGRRSAGRTPRSGRR